MRRPLLAEPVAMQRFLFSEYAGTLDSVLTQAPARTLDAVSGVSAR